MYILCRSEFTGGRAPLFVRLTNLWRLTLRQRCKHSHAIHPLLATSSIFTAVLHVIHRFLYLHCSSTRHRSREKLYIWKLELFLMRPLHICFVNYPIFEGWPTKYSLALRWLKGHASHITRRCEDREQNQQSCIREIAHTQFSFTYFCVWLLLCPLQQFAVMLCPLVCDSTW